MRDKFGLEFRIVDSDLMKQLRRERGLHVNPWTHFPRLIASIDYLKRDRPMRLFREVLPADGEPTYPRKFDLLIVDEAHNVAPPGAVHYAVDSQRTAAVRTLCPHFEHKLFLTATPHNGYPESFAALLELLDNQRFARAVHPNREQLGAVMVRRLKSELPGFPVREIEHLEVDYTKAERRVHEALRLYTQARQQHASSHAERYATEFVLKLLKKRLFSSPAAFASTLEKHAASLTTAQRVRRPAQPSERILRQYLEGLEEETADDEQFEENSVEAVEGATRLFRDLTAEEAKLLSELRAWASAAAERADSKAQKLIRWLKETLQPDDHWNDQRVLIFTEYRTTQKWLHDLLATHGLAGGDRLLTLYGGMADDEREEIKEAFQADPAVSRVRILLATDAASEGINLQNHCYRLVHYEIPWNPNRMEQRNGRLDRHGQKAPVVLVHHFVARGFDRHRDQPVNSPGELEGDLEFLMRAALKVEQIREDLGKVGPVIATQVEEAMLGRRHRLDTARAEREATQPRDMLRLERDLRAQVQRLSTSATASTRRDRGSGSRSRSRRDARCWTGCSSSTISGMRRKRSRRSNQAGRRRGAPGAESKGTAAAQAWA
jgi:SNF2 family DNA or RNA helicase